MSATRAFSVLFAFRLFATFSSFAARFPRHDMTFRAAPNDQSMVGFGRDKTDWVRALMESSDASFASRDLACRVGGACGVGAGFGAAAFFTSSLSLRAATRRACAGGKFRTRPLCLCAGRLRAGVRDARNQFAAERFAAEQLAPERLEPKQREPKLEPKQLQSIRTARRYGGVTGQRQRRAGVAGRARDQARERGETPAG